MNRRRFILSAGAAAVTAMTVGHCRLMAQKTSVLAGRRQYRIDGISCIFQPDSVIFLRDNQPILTYRTTYREKDGLNQMNSQSSQFSLVPFPCFTRLSAPTSLLPLSPLRTSAAAAFVCDNIDGVNYTAKNSKKNAFPCGQMLSNGLKWRGMSEIGSDGILTKISSLNFGIQGFFDDECEWIDPDGRVQMSDTRRFRIVFFDKARYGIYVTINWYAVDDVQITANRNCLFGVQASAPLAPTGGGPHGREDEVMPPNKLFSALTTSNREPTLSGAKPHGQKDEVMPPNKLGSKIPTSNREPTLSGAKPHGQKDEVMPPKKLGSKIPTSNREPTLSGGTMMNSNGDYGSQAIYGRRANWVTCWGQLHAANPAAAPDDNLYLQEGVALMSHPSNPWGVSPWNTTPFGYMSPTHIPFLSKPWSLRAGEGVRLRYMILAYTGDPAGAEIDELYRSYSNS